MFAPVAHLVLLSLTNPREAVREVSSILYGEALWTAAALVVALNTLIFSLSSILLGAGFLPMSVPTVLFAVVFVLGLPTAAFSVSLVGRLFGGQAGFLDMMPVVVWLNGLRALAQTVSLVAVLVLPDTLIALMSFGLFGLSLYLTLMFVDEAQGFKNLLMTGVNLIFACFAAAIMLIVVLSTLGLSPDRILQNV